MIFEPNHVRTLRNSRPLPNHARGVYREKGIVASKKVPSPNGELEVSH